MSDSKSTSPALLVLLVVVGVGVLVLLTISDIGSYRRSPQAAAIGAMKTLHIAQSLFREGDKDGDKVLDYGTLTELSEQSLIDAVMGSGTKLGYVFASAPGTGAPQLMYWATATPTAAVREEFPHARRFFVNHDGVTFYTTTDAAAPITSMAAVPPGWLPVGK